MASIDPSCRTILLKAVKRGHAYAFSQDDQLKADHTCCTVTPIVPNSSYLNSPCPNPPLVPSPNCLTKRRGDIQEWIRDPGHRYSQQWPGDILHFNFDGVHGPLDHRHLFRKFQLCRQHIGGVEAASDEGGQFNKSRVLVEPIHFWADGDVHRHGEVLYDGDTHWDSELHGWSDEAGFSRPKWGNCSVLDFKACCRKSQHDCSLCGQQQLQQQHVGSANPGGQPVKMRLRFGGSHRSTPRISERGTVLSNLAHGVVGSNLGAGSSA